MSNYKSGIKESMFCTDGRLIFLYISFVCYFVLNNNNNKNKNNNNGDYVTTLKLAINSK